MENRVIHGEILINSSVDRVWDAWTTVGGIKSFFANNCTIDARVGGPFELYFNMNVPEGDRGSEGCVFLALQPNKMISFTWNSPPHLPAVRQQRTYVTLYLDEISPSRTRLRFFNGGYGIGGEWDDSFAYFQSAWLEQVLPNLKETLEARKI